jgi:hypothetical protein
LISMPYDTTGSHHHDDWWMLGRSLMSVGQSQSEL